MDGMKLYKKALIVFGIILLLPLIIFALLVAGIYILFHIPKNKKEYKKSRYYNDLNIPFRINALDHAGYRFYNGAKERDLNINYVRQESNKYEYFIYNETVYLFPDFGQIMFEDENEQWEVDCDGDWYELQKYFQNMVTLLDDDAPKLPIKILIERRMFAEINLENVNLPNCVFLTLYYETAFGNEDTALKIKIPQNAEDLYDMMLATPKLCGKFELVNDVMFWNLNKNIAIQISLYDEECCVEINKKKSGKIVADITHWHPTQEEIYKEICDIGLKGHVLVIRKNIFGESVLYMGNEANCPYPPNKKWHFGKIYYLQSE